MVDFFEIDFLGVESPKSGDAIPLRYELSGVEYVHVVDGGYQDTGQKVIDHLKEYYNDPAAIDHVVATHPDGDHAGGLRTVLETCTVRVLWMLRPWVYAEELLPRFANYSSADALRRRLREVYPNLAALEEIAERRQIPIHEPFQGTRIGAFTVLTPTKARYLDLVVASERTPEAAASERQESAGLLETVLQKAVAQVVRMLKAVWGEEVFSLDETSAENEMSVVQYARLCEKRILLTADTGRAGLLEAADYAPVVGLALPGLDRFQVPHHGSRRNVSTEMLDRWLGSRLTSQPPAGGGHFSAIVSSAKDDKAHPRKAVVRAVIHRGGNVFATEGSTIRTAHNAPARPGWTALTAAAYPDEQEEA